MRRRWVAGALGLSGLALALLGQYYLTYRRQYYRDAIVFYAMAVVMFGLLWREARRVAVGGPRQGLCLLLQQRPARIVAACGGLALAALVGWTAARRSPADDFAGLFWLWLIGVGWFVLAFVPAPPRDWRHRVAAWLRRNRADVLRMTVLLLAALAVRAYDLTDIPRNFGGDEGHWGLQGLAMLDGQMANPFSTRWFAFPSMSFLAWGLSMRAFGETVAGLRTLSALLGTATVATTFLLARDLWGRRVAWLAALALTFGQYHMHFSRLAVNNIADGLIVTLALALLGRGLRARQPVYFVLTGVALGAGWYGYFGARLVGGMVGLYLVWRGLAERGFLGKYGAALILTALAGLVVVFPLLFHYASYPDALLSRYNQVSIFSSGWLSREVQITGRSATSLLLQQFWKSVSAFHYTLDPTFWYRPTAPLLDFVSGVLVIAGMVWVVVGWRQPGNRMLLIWYWLSVVMGWTLTENPPSSMRLVIVTPALAILVGLGCDRVLALGRQFVGGRIARWRAICAGVLCLAAALNLGHYFLQYAPTRVYGNPTAEVADVLCDVLQDRSAVPPVYFDGAPYMYWDFGAIAFRLRGVQGHDIFPDEDWPVEIDLNRGALFVILGLKAPDLDGIREAYPGGSVAQYTSDEDGRLLFVLYEVPARREE